jgi:hypothetical protein
MEKNYAGSILRGGLAMLFARPAFAADVQPAASAVAMSPSVIVGHAQASLMQLGGLLPTLGWAVLILVVGCLLAVVVARLLDFLFDAIRLEKGAKRLKIPDILKRGGIGLPLSGIITLVGGNARIAHAQTLGQMTKYAIVIVAGLVALKELGLGVLVTERARDLVLASVVFGVALAFGLGAKERAKNFLDNVLKK